MARTPKPWFWARRGVYLVTINGTRHNLGPDKDEAHRRFHELMATKDLPPAPPSPLPPSDLTAVEVFDKFLDDCRFKVNAKPQEMAERTFEWYRDRIQSFVDHWPKLVVEPCAALKPFHVEEWVKSHEGWGAAYRRGAIIAVQRPFNWAEKSGYITATPIKHIKKPKPERRENAVTKEDWTKIKAHYAEGDPFLALLEFSWETGCRPQESKRIEARHVQLARSRVVFPPDEAKGKKRWRVIHMTERAIEIVGPLVAANRTGPVFLNEDGRPWNPQSMSCRFERLKKHVGVKFAAYDFRHGFCEKLLEAGADHLSVAALMGHKDGKMVAEVYSHLGNADRHLRETLKKAGGGGAA